jgi:hypothetical protein
MVPFAGGGAIFQPLGVTFVWLSLRGDATNSLLFGEFYYSIIPVFEAGGGRGAFLNGTAVGSTWF